MDNYEAEPQPDRGFQAKRRPVFQWAVQVSVLHETPNCLQLGSGTLGSWSGLCGDVHPTVEVNEVEPQPDGGFQAKRRPVFQRAVQLNLVGCGCVVGGLGAGAGVFGSWLAPYRDLQRVS